MLRLLSFIAVLIMATGLIASPVVANDIDLCNEKNPSPETMVAACTRLIGSGRLRGTNLALGYNLRGAAWMNDNNLERAFADANEAIRINPQLGSAYNLRCRAWMKRGDFDRAIVDCNEAIRLDPKNVSALNDRCVTWLQKHEHDSALVDCNEAIRLNPKISTLYLNRCSVFADKGEYIRATLDCDQAIRLDPKMAGPYAARCLVWLKRDENGKAISDCEEAVRLEPNSAQARLAFAAVFYSKGEFDRAISEYDQVTRLDPKNSDAFNSRCYAIWKNRGDLGRALRDCDDAIRINPKNAQYFGSRCAVLVDKGDLDRAIADCEEAIRLNPSLAVAAYTQRGRAYEKRGDSARAQADFAAALALPDTALLNPGDVAEARATARQRMAILAVTPTTPIKAQAPSSPSAIVADTGRRVALVIGNSAYKSVAALPNPQRDAETVATMLRRIGFERVTLELNLGREKLVDALRNFSAEAEKADWAVIYFAGHGIEVGGLNYLVPVDAKLQTDRDVQYEAIALDQVLGAVEGAKKLRLVLLDACRDNPFLRQIRRSVASRSIGRGLGSVEPDAGTLVVYAAKHGEVALDGDGANSPFVTALLKDIATPGIEVRKLFDLVRDDVMDATNRRQQPFTYGSLPGRQDFYFVQK